jgi:hypothetical protein
MSHPIVVGLVHPGEMGAAVGAALIASGDLSCLELVNSYNEED